MKNLYAVQYVYVHEGDVVLAECPICKANH